MNTIPTFACKLCGTIHTQEGGYVSTTTTCNMAGKPCEGMQCAETDDYKLFYHLSDPTTIYVVESPFDGKADVYHDHQHDGSGATNLQVRAFDRDLDLEFCSSIYWEYLPE